MSLVVKRTDSTHKDFVSLVEKLDAYLKIVDGDDHGFYNQYNGLDTIKYVVLVYQNEVPVGCGAIKHFNEASVEVKRMFVEPKQRGSGIASIVLENLEVWAKELGYTSVVLETGKRQIEAVKFYQKSKYVSIENYGQYKGIENSICFEKQL